MTTLPATPITPVADLLTRAHAYVTHSHAKNTLDAYAADWKHFHAWCDTYKRRALPASPETILCYLVDLWVANKGSSGNCAIHPAPLFPYLIPDIRP